MGSQASRVGDAAGTPDVGTEAWKKLVKYLMKGDDNKDERLRREKEDRA